MIHKLTSAVATTLMTLLIFNGARAEEACPPDISPADPVVTEWKGLPLETPGYVNVRGAWLKVPIGYWLWEPASKRDIYLLPPSKRSELAADALGFAFWMPSGRWVERLAGGQAMFHACEQGRPRPTERDFKVSSELQWPGLDWEEGAAPFTTVAEQKRNILAGLALPSEEREFGLVRYRRPYQNSKQYYGNAPEEPFEIQFDCSLPTTVPFPSCEGEVWWPTERYLFRVYFSQRDLPHWRAIIEMQRKLVNDWRDAVEL